MNNPFTQTAISKVKSSYFEMNHDYKTTFNMGELVPVLLLETLPGDYWKIQIENFLRFQPLIAPVMHMVNVITDIYFVPNRIIWDEWEDFIREQSEISWAYCTLPDLTIGNLGDYLGLPILSGGTSYQINISCLPIAAYAKIWDEWYRDQNLQTEIYVPVVAGTNPAYASMLDEPCLRRAWQHDYFTSCLPFAQKGDAVTMPLTDGPVPVELSNFEESPSWRDGTGAPIVFSPNYDAYMGVDGAGGDAGFWNPFDVTGSPGTPDPDTFTNAWYNPEGTLTVNPDQTAVTINTFRRAIRLQEFLERDARAGTRYNEVTLAHFDTPIPDARVQRPEFIGRSYQHMTISEVLSQAETLDTEDQISQVVGDMAGHGISVGGTRSFNYRCTEWGYIIGLINVQPTTAYSQGIDRHWRRMERLDYPWPTFAHIGEQEVKMVEIYADREVDPDELFGYIPRYSEMRYQTSQVTGDFRDELDYWAWTRLFDSAPALNEDFIKCVPRTDMFAAGETPRPIIGHIIKNCSVSRKLPKHGIPTI